MRARQTLPFDIDDLRPWIEVAFTRSPGPGGQNVNKVSTRVTLVFDFETCPVIPEAKKPRIRGLLASRLSRDGRLRVVSYGERSQARNRAATEQKLLELLENAMRIPKIRRPTRPTAGSRRRRLADKRCRSELKRRRRTCGEE